MKPTSIKDIATRAKVSITTVSFILNGKGEKMRISRPVIDNVRSIIREMEFVPNQVARSLRTGNTKTIGLIVEDISNPFFASIARKIEDKAYKLGYKISYSSTENDVRKAKELIDMFKARKVDAYIIAPVPGMEAEIKQLVGEGIPVVIFDRNLHDLDVNFVGVDNFNGAYLATQHLINQGKKHIGFVTVDLDVDQMNNRFLGYKQALADAGIPFNDEIYRAVAFGSSDLAISAQLIELFSEQPEIDSVLFSTNYLAIKGLGALKDLDRSLGPDLDIVSYDDHDVFRLHTPPISVIDQPIEDMAEKIIDILLQELTRNKTEKQIEQRSMVKIVLQPRLIER
ncbi:LacI family DNA-binding transcriptional regulator [Pedobacter faecalis]|uniref:LacI family DNA-binding transcriptional regulator n=1 Tax=Pedobacter faecalis TaxID=3041495 RepID=UPI00254EF500|nr:substrate-binding domain-containing protein [Pedobacter sp. ELA7]